MRTLNITSQKLKLFYLNFFFLSRPSLPQLYFKLQCQTSTDELNVSSPAFVFCVPSYYFFHCCAHTQTCVQFYVLSIGSNFPSNHIAKGNKKREKIFLCEERWQRVDLWKEIFIIVASLAQIQLWVDDGFSMCVHNKRFLFHFYFYSLLCGS